MIITLNTSQIQEIANEICGKTCPKYAINYAIVVGERIQQKLIELNQETKQKPTRRKSMLGKKK